MEVRQETYNALAGGGVVQVLLKVDEPGLLAELPDELGDPGLTFTEGK